MWEFWKKRAQKAQVRAAFGEFVSEQVLRDLENAQESRLKEMLPLEKETISYVILQVRGDTLEDIQSNLAQAFETIFDNEGFIESTISSIFTVTFKTAPDLRNRSIQALRDKLGSTVRAVYGHGEFARGVYGSPRRSTYGTILPDIGTKLGALLQLEFGTWKEV
jgi:hypothetical protein